MFKITLVLLIVSSVNHLTHGDQCAKRKYTSESFVCVCNQTYCDKLQLEIDSADGLIYTFTSDRDENRFHKDVHNPKDLAKQVSDDSIKVSVHVGHLKQQINGFGGAFTDASVINIKSLPEDLAVTLMENYYTSIGLEYTMGRVPVGGSDFSTRPYTYQDNSEDLEWNHFALADEDLSYKIPIIQMANNMSGGLKLFGSMWSPPAWMKYQNRINGTGILKGDPGGPYYKAMANYIVKFLDEYKKHGVEFWGLTTLNEPSAGFKPGYAFNCLGLSPEMFTEWIAKDLGPALEAAGYGKDNIKLMIVDDNISLVVLYASRILSDARASKYVSGIAVHWYEHDSFGYDDFDKVHNSYPDYFILSTEACDGIWTDRGVVLGAWDRAEHYASDIIENLNHWGTGWIDWNLALDLGGGPNWVSNWVDAPIAVNPKDGEFYKQPTYYALAHFTKFLHPGSRGIGFDVSNSDPKVKLTVLLNRENQIVISALNTKDDSANLSFTGITKDTIGLTIGPHSITTVVVNNRS